MFLFPNLIHSFNKCFLQIKKTPKTFSLSRVSMFVCVHGFICQSLHTRIEYGWQVESTGSQLESEGCFPLWQIFSNVILLVSQRKQVDFFSLKCPLTQLIIDISLCIVYNQGCSGDVELNNKPNIGRDLKQPDIKD